MSIVNTVIFTPPIESKNVSSFLWTGADGKGEERRLGLNLYVGEGEGTYTTQSPFQKQGSVGREPSLLDLFQ